MSSVSRTRVQISRTLGVLLAVFALACLMGYFVVRDAINKTVEHEAP